MIAPAPTIESFANGEIDLFICSSSFEERSISVAERLDFKQVKRALICIQDEHLIFPKQTLPVLIDKFNGKCVPVFFRTDSPVTTADAIISALSEVRNSDSLTVLFDVTTFTNESLLIVLQAIRTRIKCKHLYIAYTGAKEYGVGLGDDHKWLSKGVDNVRSVLGYPGMLLPSRELHLVVLVGFESERAKSLIDEIQASSLSLGSGSSSESITRQHYQLNSFFCDKVEKSIQSVFSQYSNVSKFHFSPSNPFETKRTILSEVQKHNDYNVIVAPMNTKLSTVGVALAAFADPKIQLAYSHPVQYNYQGYSTPGKVCNLIDIAYFIAS